MSVRLIVAIISILLEEGALAIIVLWGLPRLGVQVPLPGLIALMVVWAAISIVMYRVGSRALKRKPVISLPDMIGGRGKVVSPLAPEGLVKVKGELWMAESSGKKINLGVKIVVVAQDGLRLVVRESKTDNLGKAE